ncbi:MAG: SLBB domain-containing protein, partial [Ilumatobacteraceae bacterium]
MPVEDIADEDLDVGLARPSHRGGPHPGGRLRPWIEWFGAGRLVAGALTIVALVAVGWWLLRSPAAPIEAGLPQATATSSATSTATAAPSTSGAPVAVIVHVAGAVSAPGVYELPTGARVESALLAAGGPTGDADPSALNLAAVVADGERVYVPVVGEA